MTIVGLLIGCTSLHVVRVTVIDKFRLQPSLDDSALLDLETSVSSQGGWRSGVGSAFGRLGRDLKADLVI